MSRMWKSSISLLVLSAVIGLSIPVQAISTESYNHYRRAVGFERQQSFDQAVQEYRMAISLDPYDSLNYIRLASLLVKRGEPNEAISLYTQALKLTPNDRMLHLSVAQLLEANGQDQQALDHYRQLMSSGDYPYGFLQMARLLVKMKQPAEALDTYNRFLAVYPSHFDARREQAALFLDQKQFDQAAADYHALQQIDQHKFSDTLPYAYSLNQSGKPEEALATLSQLPNKTAADWEQMGYSYEQLSRPTDAYDAYGQSVQIAPQDKNALLLKMADIAEKQDRPDKVTANLERYLTFHPDNTQIAKSLADVYLKDKQMDKALSTYSNVLAKLPDGQDTPLRFDILRNMGYIYQVQNNLAQAIPTYEAALKLNGTDVQTRTNLALAYHRNQDYDKALALYRDLIKENPGTASLKADLLQVLLALGDKAYQAQNVDQAKADYQEAYLLSSRPEEMSKALLGLANIQYAQNDHDQAYDTYLKVLQQDPGNTTAQLNKAKLDLERQNPMAAVETLRALTEAHPELLEAHVMLGKTHMEMGDMGQAILSFRKAKELSPNNPNILLSYGSALQKVGELDQAQQLYEEARDFSPENALVHYNLASVYTQKNMLDQSIQAYHKALELNPGFVESWYGLGITLEKQKKYNEALEVYQTYLQKAPPTAAYLNQAKERIEILQKVPAAKPATSAP